MMRRSNLSRERYDGADFDEALVADYHLGHIALEEFIASQFNNRLSNARKNEVPEDTDLNDKGNVTLILHAWGNGKSDSITSSNITNLSTTMKETGVKSVQETLKSNINTIRNNVLNAGKYLLNVNPDTDSNSNNSYSFATGELDADAMTVTVEDDDDDTILDVDEDFDEEGEFDEDGFEYAEEPIEVDEIEVIDLIQNENKQNIMRKQDLLEYGNSSTNDHVTFADIVKGVKYTKSPKSVKQFQNENCQNHQAGMKMVKILIESEPKTINDKNSYLQGIGYSYNQRGHNLIVPCENNFSNSLQSKLSSVNQSILDSVSEAYESVDKEICFLY